MMDFITVALMGSAHWIEYVVTLVFAALLMLTVLRRGAFTVMSMRTWWGFVIGFQVFFATVLTVAQYRMWQASEITRELVTAPLGEEVPRMLIHLPVSLFLEGRGGYYVFYAYTHFWVPILIGLLGTAVVYALFRFLQQRKPVAIGYEEVFLVTGVSFLAGWPNMIAFLLLTFVLAVIHASISRIRQGTAARTRMLAAIITAAIVTLTFTATIAAYTAMLAV